MRPLLIALLTVIAAAVPVQAQRIVGAVSDHTVSINSTFVGETLTLFGNVEASVGAESPVVEGPFDIVTVIRGPVQDRVIRRKTNVAGLWINTEQTTFGNFPSFQWVLSSDRLDNIADDSVYEAAGILPGAPTPIVTVSGNGDPEEMRNQLIRLMAERSLFGVNERGVTFRSPTLYSASIQLPANVPPGNFLAQTYLFKNGELIAQEGDSFSVRKIGFERFLGDFARNTPLIYGLTCVLLAVFTGWLGGVAFRR